MTDLQTDHRWHLDRRVPLALILAIVVQTAALGIWVGTIQTRVSQLEKIQDARSSQLERIVTVESRLAFMAETLSRLERKIDIALEQRR